MRYINFILTYCLGVCSFFLQFGRLLNGGLCRYARRYSACVFSRERSYTLYIVVGYVLRVTESLSFLVQVKYNVRLLLVLS